VAIEVASPGNSVEELDLKIDHTFAPEAGLFG
jgi:hypothetical protein